MKSVLMLIALILLSVPFQVLGDSSCPASVCPGSRQVVAFCCTNDTVGTSNTFWKGTNIVGCGALDYLILPHAASVAATDTCSTTSFIADIVSVDLPVFTSEISLVPMSSNDGDTVGCYSPGLDDLVHQCTLNVLSVNVTGVLEQQDLSGVIIIVGLVESSDSVCVDEYFTVVNGTRINNTISTFGPFSMDLCSSPGIPDVTVGTSSNGVDGPTASISFKANTTDLYSNLGVTHMFDDSGVNLDLSWMVVDQKVMTQSDVSCSCLSSPMTSDSPTNHILQISYGQFTNEQSSSPQVNLSVSYQNVSCRDIEFITFNVVNFGTATVSSSDSETVFFNFNPTLLARGVTVTSIRGMCEVDDDIQLIFWDYQQNFSINFSSTCVNGPYVFQALNGMNRSIGFPFTIQIGSPTNTSIDAAVIGAAVGGSCAVLLAVIILLVIALLYYYYLKKDNPVCKDAEKDELTCTNSGQLPPDSLYTDSKSIEHQAAPGTEDQYTMVDKKRKKNTKPKPTPPEALYQDPSTIEHVTAASGDIYTVVNKPKRSFQKEGGPDVIPPASEGSKLIEEATKPNSSQLPQELYSEVFNALPKGMAPKVMRNGTKN